MKLPLHIEGVAVRDAEGRVIISGLNPCNMAERRLIVRAVNATMKDADADERELNDEWMGEEEEQ